MLVIVYVLVTTETFRYKDESHYKYEIWPFMFFSRIIKKYTPLEASLYFFTRKVSSVIFIEGA